MRVLAESSKDLRHEFKIEIPSQEIESQVEQSLVEYGKTAKIPGFRPGKIPMHVLKQRFEADVRSDAISKAVRKSMVDLLTEKSLQPATNPKIEVVEGKEGQDLTYTLELEVLPEITLKDFDAIKVTNLVVKLTDKDIDEHLTKLIAAQKRTSAVEKPRKSKEGDTVVIDAVASHPEFDASEQGFEAFSLLLGQNHLEAFDKALIGKQAGDVVDIDFTLPENFPNKPFAGKTLSYKTS
jgi:trigger factor